MPAGVAFLPPSFPPSRIQAFYIIKRQNCLNICNTVYDHDTYLGQKVENHEIKRRRSVQKKKRSKLVFVELQKYFVCHHHRQSSVFFLHCRGGKPRSKVYYYYYSKHIYQDSNTLATYWQFRFLSDQSRQKSSLHYMLLCPNDP